MPVATPTSPEPSHHLTLSDGTTTIGLVLVDKQGNADPSAITKQPMKRTPDQVSEGDLEYSDFAGPHRPIAQADWSKGRGQEDFIDPRRFYDSFRVNTWIPGQITLGGQETYSTGHRNQNMTMPGSVTWTSLRGTTRYLARSFVTTAAYSADGAYLWVRRVGTPTGNLVVEINSNSAGDPGTALQTVTVTPATFGTDQVSRLYFFDWASTQSLTNATTYWVKIYSSAADTANNDWQVATSATVGTTEASSDNSTWAAASVGLYYRVVDAEDERLSLFYEYKGGLYFVTADVDGSTAPKIYINGDRGAADDNTGALTTLIDATKTWTTDEWANSIVKITAGPGFIEEQNWRTISSNTGTALTVSPAWNIVHTTSTEYVIVAADKWTEITGHGLTAPVADVLISSGVVYYAQGEAVNIRRHREYDNAGTWTSSDWADDGTNKAVFLKKAQDPVNGDQVWRANSPAAGTAQSVSRATVQAWGTDLTFGTAIAVGDNDERIRGLEVYGAPETLWVLKEGSVWTIIDDIAVPIPLREMTNVRSAETGVAHIVNNVYLYFSLLNSVQEYYRAEINNIGPSTDAGLPDGRQGPVAYLLGYPGQIIACIDGGSSGTSSVLRYRAGGWHEEYRAPITGRRIRRAHIQVTPGSAVDRLWISQGTDILWVPLPSVTFDPYRDSNFRFVHEGTITSSWHYANLQDVRKFFSSLKVFAENLSAAAQIIDAEYQTDDANDASSWTAISGTFDTSPVEEVDITSTSPPNITGRRIRYRLRLQTNANTETPRVKASVLEVISRPTVKFAYSFRFRAQDENLDLEGDDDTYTAVQTLTAQLETWANAPTVLTMRAVFSPFDSKEVLIDPAKLQPRLLSPDDQTEQHIGEMTVFEI